MTQSDETSRIVAGLSELEREFLGRVCDGRPLGCADRVEDRARQKCRRGGLVLVAKSPRRWVATPLGLAVRAHLKDTTHAG